MGKGFNCQVSKNTFAPLVRTTLVLCGMTPSGPLYRRCQDFDTLAETQQEARFFRVDRLGLERWVDLVTFLSTHVNASPSLCSSSKDEYLYHR